MASIGSGEAVRRAGRAAARLPVRRGRLRRLPAAARVRPGQAGPGGW